MKNTGFVLPVLEKICRIFDLFVYVVRPRSCWFCVTAVASSLRSFKLKVTVIQTPYASLQVLGNCHKESDSESQVVGLEYKIEFTKNQWLVSEVRRR